MFFNDLNMMEVIVISVGGSIIVPGEVDLEFLKRLKEIMMELRKEYKIVICTGGGHTARSYISALRGGGVTGEELDWMGIEITRINARLVASFIGDANDMIPRSEEEVAGLLEQYDIVVCGGLKPGQTSDGTTAMIAKHLRAKKIVNMTNVDGLFTKDPKKHKDAKFIPEISHKEFLKIVRKVGQETGQHFVLDIKAAEIAAKENITVFIIKGVNNLKKCIKGEDFKGTVIK